MARLARWICLSLAGAMLAAGCSSAGPSPQPSPPDGTPFLLRATIVQALPPDSTFGWLPGVLVTADGRVLTAGAVPAIYPGPLLAPVSQRFIPPAGWALVVAAARELGLLGGSGDFSGGVIAPGGLTGRLELWADGRMYELRGDPSRLVRCGQQRCVPDPGTPEAFATFWNQALDLANWPGLGLGQETAYVPDRYAVLVGAPPAEDPLSAAAVAWPGSTPLATLGLRLADGSGGRCGTVSGPDVAPVGAAFRAATAISRWHDAGSATLYGLTVRPLLPGDGDPCAGMVGA